MIRAHDFNSSSTYVYGRRTSTTAQPWPIYVAFLDLVIIREFIVLPLFFKYMMSLIFFV